MKKKTDGTSSRFHSDHVRDILWHQSVRNVRQVLTVFKKKFIIVQSRGNNERKTRMSTEDELRELCNMSLEESVKRALAILSPKTRKNRLAALVHDINKCKTSVEVQRIMYNVILAGDGMITVGSAWNKRYGS